MTRREKDPAERAGLLVQIHLRDLARYRPAALPKPVRSLLVSSMELSSADQRDEIAATWSALLGQRAERLDTPGGHHGPSGILGEGQVRPVVDAVDSFLESLRR
jgi:hypothetical protein